MATKMPRLNVVMEQPIYFAVVELARRDGVSLSLKARELIKQAIEFCEDIHWSRQASLREKSLRHRKTLSHKAVWGK